MYLDVLGTKPDIRQLNMLPHNSCFSLLSPSLPLADVLPMEEGF